MFSQSTPQQMEKWLAKAKMYQMIGTYAQTVRPYVSNAKHSDNITLVALGIRSWKFLARY